MANRALKTEHAGHKGHGQGAYYGHRADAKAESNTKRRAVNRAVATDELKDLSAD